MLIYLYFRFGTVAYKAGPITRRIKVKNISSIPIHTTWQLFIMSELENGKDNLKIFNHIWETVVKNSDNIWTCPSVESRIIVKDEFFGAKNSKVFQVM